MRLVIALISLIIAAFQATIASADELAVSQTVQAGQQAEYRFELRNETAFVHDYNLAVHGLANGLETSFSQGGAILTTVSLDAASFEFIILQIDVPLDWTIGHYTAELLVSRDDGVSLRLPLALTVENTYALQIVSQNLNLSSFGGQEFTFEVEAANTGAATVNHLRVIVDSPAKWIVESTPLSIDTLGPNETASFSMRVYIPASEAASEEVLTLRLESDEVASAGSGVLVLVQDNPDKLIYASLVALIVVTAVFVYFRIRGRR